MAREKGEKGRRSGQPRSFPFSPKPSTQVRRKRRKTPARERKGMMAFPGTASSLFFLSFSSAPRPGEEESDDDKGRERETLMSRRKRRKSMAGERKGRMACHDTASFPFFFLFPQHRAHEGRNQTMTKVERGRRMDEGLYGWPANCRFAFPFPFPFPLFILILFFEATATGVCGQKETKATGREGKGKGIRQQQA